MPVAPQVTHPGVYIQELPGNENKCQVTNQVSLDCHTREGGYPCTWIPAFAGMTCIDTMLI